MKHIAIKRTQYEYQCLQFAQTVLDCNAVIISITFVSGFYQVWFGYNEPKTLKVIDKVFAELINSNS